MPKLLTLACVSVLLTVCCNASANGASPTTTTAQQAEFSHVDRTQLRRDFTDAFRADFEIGADRLVLDGQKQPWWIVEIRPRKAGDFVVRYDCRVRPHISPAENFQREYHLAIGQSGHRRMCISTSETHFYPLACVGDTVLIPVSVHNSLTDFRFSRTSFQLRSFDYSKGEAERFVSADRPDRSVLTIVNEADEYLRVAASKAESEETHKTGLYMVVLQATLEARKPGEFNVQIVPKSQGVPSRVAAMRVVPKEVSVSVIPTFMDERNSSGSSSGQGRVDFPSDIIALRTGDQIAMLLYEYTFSRDDRVPTTQPAIEIRKLPFAPPKGRFANFLTPTSAPAK